MKLGEICFLPKVKVGGEFTLDVEDMRPITLLPELGKLVNRILAKRTCKTTQICCMARRGASSRMATCRSASTLSWMCLKIGKNISESRSYDLRKAFDSVQEYSLRAALKKMGMPAGFVKYAFDDVRGKKSRSREAWPHPRVRHQDIRAPG